MTNIASSPHSDALEQSLLAQLHLPESSLRALRRVRELERELMLLRGNLAVSPAQPGTSKQAQVAQLLSKVVLLRLSLAETSSFDATVSSSRRDEATAYCASADKIAMNFQQTFSGVRDE